MAKATVTSLQPNRAHALTEDCLKLADRHFLAVVKDVFSHADDVLFKLANSADNSKHQGLYFDGMRELRLKRAGIELTFSEEFARSYRAAIERIRAPAKSAPGTFNGELSLVDLDDVEESLALANLIAALRTRTGRELHTLDRRIAALLKQPQLSADTNPLGPHPFGDALRCAMKPLAAGLEVKITLYKLFDKVGGSGIARCYVELNELLNQAGVLPELGTPAPTAGAPRRTRVIIESEGEGHEASGDDAFATIAQLMHGHFAGGAGNGGIAPSIKQLGGGLPPVLGAGLGTGYATGQATGGFPPLGNSGESAGVLVDSLTALQRGIDGAMNTVPSALGVAPHKLQAGTYNVLRDLRASGAIGLTEPAQDVTLEIVSVLFDYLLEDRAIPDAMKALLGRLQIPMLKVALIDRNLFSRKSHPARRLLDALARAAVGWYEELSQSDALFAEVERVVRRITSEFEHDVALFAQVLSEFNAFIERESACAEERARASTRSLHTRERIALAKMAVDDTLRARLKGIEVRDFVQNFLYDYWRQLLIITHVEEGIESATWQAQLATADELVWSVQAKSSAEDRRALSARLPPMLKAIKAGMLALEMPAAECSKFLSMLAAVHVVAIKSIEESSIAARKLAEPRPAVPPAPARALDDPASEEFIKRGLARIFERKAEGAPLELDIDFSAFEPTTDEAPAAVDDEDLLAPHIAQATSLDLGDWVEFKAADGSVARGRFTWISETSGRYLFTNRHGDKMRDATLIELVHEFREGRASIIRAETDPLFDRMLSELIDRLEAENAA